MLGILGLVIVGVTMVIWFRLIQQVAIPRNRAPYLIAAAIGALVGALGAFGPGGWSSGGWLGSIAGILAAVGGTLFLLLRLQSGQKRTEPAVGVGGLIPAFSALDENGENFELARLSGKPFLLKFFRGHW